MEKPCCCDKNCCSLKICLIIWAILSTLSVFSIFYEPNRYLKYAKDAGHEAETYHNLEVAVSSMNVVKGVLLGATLATMSSNLAIAPKMMIGVIALEAISGIGLSTAQAVYGINKRDDICIWSIAEGISKFKNVCGDDEDILDCQDNCTKMLEYAGYAVVITILFSIYMIIVEYSFMEFLKMLDFNGYLQQNNAGFA